MSEFCDLEFVRQEGDRYIHRCPVCGAEARSKYADPSMRKQLCGTSIIAGGPGDEFRRLIRSLGLRPKKECDCEKLRREMNKLGVDGCRARREELLAKLRKNSDKYGLGEWAAAGWSALWQGKPLSLGGLFDLAIERAAKQAPNAGTPRELSPE